MKLLLVDDHPLFRAGFHALLAQRLPDIGMMSVATRAEAEQLLEHDPEIELVLLDVHLQEGDGFDVLRSIGARFPTVACIMISGDEQGDVASRALALGASGFILKSLTVDATVAAIRRVLAGDVIVPARIVPPVRSVAPALTLRQLEVMSMLGQGLTNKEIALELQVAERTVKAHISAVFEALGVRNRTEAVVEAHRRGLLGSNGAARVPS
jgi:two-component system, NarL family, nitrate/nitrite response regulator NarL